MAGKKIKPQRIAASGVKGELGCATALLVFLIPPIAVWLLLKRGVPNVVGALGFAWLTAWSLVVLVVVTAFSVRQDIITECERGMPERTCACWADTVTMPPYKLAGELFGFVARKQVSDAFMKRAHAAAYECMGKLASTTDESTLAVLAQECSAHHQGQLDECLCAAKDAQARVRKGADSADVEAARKELLPALLTCRANANRPTAVAGSSSSSSSGASGPARLTPDEAKARVAAECATDEPPCPCVRHRASVQPEVAQGGTVDAVTVVLREARDFCAKLTPELVDGIVATCMSEAGTKKERTKERCTCAAENFADRAKLDTLMELMRDGWNPERTAALMNARAACGP